MNYLNLPRGDLRIAALLFLAVSLGGCFASPDYSQITCKSDKQCAPSYPHCDLTINKCRAGVDGAWPGEAGRLQTDGMSGDSANGADGRAADQSIVDAAATQEAAGNDAAGSSDVSSPDVPLTPDVPLAPDVSLTPDVPLTSDTQIRVDLAPPDLGSGGAGGTGGVSSGGNGGNGSGGSGSGGASSGGSGSGGLQGTGGSGSGGLQGTGGSGSGGLQGTGGSGSGGLQGTGGSLPCGGTCPDPTTGSATGHGICAGTTCQVQCTSAYHLCGTNACYGNSDSQHCGSSCLLCSAPTGGTATCIGDTCGMSCGAQTLCGTTCTNTDTDAQNCGRCLHSCGGSATCSNGRCQPVAMVSALPSTAGYDVGPDGLFYTSGATVYGCTQTSCSGTNQRQIAGGFANTSDLVLTRGMTPNQVVFDASQGPPNYGLYACPVTTGCPTNPTQVVGYGETSQTSLVSFQTYNGDVYYQNAGTVTAIYHCAGTSSSCTLVAGGGPGTAHLPSANNSLDVARAFATDATYLYYLESIDSFNDFALDRCPNNSSCASPSGLVASIFTPTILVAYSGKLYWSLSKSGDPIAQCALPACANQTNFLTATVGAVLGMAADSSGLYWMTTSGLNTCPLTGCPGSGPTVITSSVVDGSKELRVQDSSVYWLTPGSGTDGVIYRVAKP
jgi:hypothetical protein